MARQASRLAVMHTAPTVQFPKSVFKAQGLKQEAYAHPRDVKTGGYSRRCFSNLPRQVFYIRVSIVCNVRFKSTEIHE